MPERALKPAQLRRALLDLSVAAALLTSGCAGHSQAPSAPQAAVQEENFHDPFENVNRKIFGFNQAVDKHVLVPVAKTYRDALSGPIRGSIHDFLNNLNAPLIFANDVLQGNLPLAKDTFSRFVLDSTIGMAGLVDVAGRWGIPYHENDLGVTFGVWGIPPGPYLVIPVLGPSDPRDLGGAVAQGFGDPWNRLAANHSKTWIIFVRGAVAGIDQRSRLIDTLADIERTSLDYYATIRSLYRQRREALVHRKHEQLPPNPAFTRNGGATIGMVGEGAGPEPQDATDAANGPEVHQ